MSSDRLFDPPPRFEGLPPDGFEAFAIRDRVARRRRILETFHPPLRALGDDLIEGLRSTPPLRLHLPRLDWPAGYQPFCTWLALSRRAQGYQAEAQLNVGVHPDHVSIRLGWDTSAPGFGRFAFLCRNGSLGDELRTVARETGLRLRVYASSPWPQGSRAVHESEDDLTGALRAVERIGVWFELGERHELPESRVFATGPELGSRALAVFSALLPFYERLSLE